MTAPAKVLTLDLGTAAPEAPETAVAPPWEAQQETPVPAAAPSPTEAQPETNADALRRLTAEAEPLAERLAVAEAALAALEAAPVPAGGCDIEALIARRKADNIKRADLEAERDVINIRLQSLRERIAELKHHLAKERKVKLRAKAIADADVALERVSQARVALDAAAEELVEVSTRARQSGLPFAFVTEIARKFDAELPAIVGIARKIDIAINH